MKAKIIKGLGQIQSKYDAFFIDLWGVIHNGVDLYPDAINVLENLIKFTKYFSTLFDGLGALDINTNLLSNLIKFSKTFIASG